MIHMRRTKEECKVEEYGGKKYKVEEMEGYKMDFPDGAVASNSILRSPETAYMVGKVREGLPFDEFHALQDMLGLTEERMGVLLGMSRATLHRRKKLAHLDRSESDRLVRYARVLTKAAELFESREDAARWLSTPALAFGQETPLDYADTEIGAREVEALIGRLEHGVFS